MAALSKDAPRNGRPAPLASKRRICRGATCLVSSVGISPERQPSDRSRRPALPPRVAQVLRSRRSFESREVAEAGLSQACRRRTSETKWERGALTVRAPGHGSCLCCDARERLVGGGCFGEAGGACADDSSCAAPSVSRGGDRGVERCNGRAICARRVSRERNVPDRRSDRATDAAHASDAVRLHVFRRRRVGADELCGVWQPAVSAVLDCNWSLDCCEFERWYADSGRPGLDRVLRAD